MSKGEMFSVVENFGGLSDKNMPATSNRSWSPDLLNVEFGNKAFERRQGFLKLHSERLKTASAKFDGIDDFIYNRLSTPLIAANQSLYFSVNVKWVQSFRTTGTFTFAHLGGNGGNECFKLYVNSTAIGPDTTLWSLRYWNGAANIVVTVADNAAHDTHRQIVVRSTGATDYVLAVYSEAGALIGQQAFALASWNMSAPTTANPMLILGTNLTSSPIIRGIEYFSGLLADVRYGAMTQGTVPSAFGTAGAYVPIAGRQLRSTELTGLTLYSRLDGVFSNIVGGPNWISGAEGAEWVTAPYAINGGGLRFNGAFGVDPATAANLQYRGGFLVIGTSAIVSNAVGAPDFYGRALTGPHAWTVGCIFTPQKVAGVFLDQTIMWAGTTANPGPWSIRLELSFGVMRFVARYRPNGATTTLVSTFTVTENVRTLLQLTVGSDTVAVTCLASFRVSQSGVPSTTAITTATGLALPATIVAGDVGTIWGVGDHVTSMVTMPPTTDGTTAVGVVDEIFAFDSTASAAGIAIAGPLGLLGPVQSTGGRIVIYAGLDEASGSHTYLSGLFASDCTVGMFPESGAGIVWGRGLVLPSDITAAYIVHDFKKFDVSGSYSRNMLASSGSTLYSIDVDTNAVAIVGDLGGVPSKPMTAAQYSDRVYIGGETGKRPVMFDGTNTTSVGIFAPVSGPVFTTSGVGGTIPAGTYRFAVTYGSSEKGIESNPGPAVVVTLAGATSSITGVLMPISSDPQVTERFLYCSAVNAAAGSTLFRQVVLPDNKTAGLAGTSYLPITTLNTTTAVTILGSQQAIRSPAPQGSIVCCWDDRLWVGGNAELPTVVYYSQRGKLESFDLDLDFVDADLDSGDPVTGLVVSGNMLMVMLRDGRVGLTATGNSDDPYATTYFSKDTGGVGPNAVVKYEGGALMLSETDIYALDGASASNLSTPIDQERPSIRTLLSGTKSRAGSAVSAYRKKSQFWFSLPVGTARNDTVVVLNEGGAWSRYAMDIDSLREVEGVSDYPNLYGTSGGFVVKMDTGDFDGVLAADTAATLVGLVTSSTTTQIVCSIATYTVDAYVGTYVSWLSGGTITRARIASNTASVLTFPAVASAPDAGSVYIIGGIAAYADFVPNFGKYPYNISNTLSKKRLKWLIVHGHCSVSTILRVSVNVDVFGRSYTWAATDYFVSWTAGVPTLRIPIGSVGYQFRVRVGETSTTLVAGSQVAEVPIGRVQISSVIVVCEGVEAQ